MTRLVRSRRGVLAVLWAVVGMLGGHVLTYAILFPEAHVHDAVLADSGHGWTAVLGPAVLTALVVAVGLGLLGGRRWGRGRSVRFVLLAALQVSLFVGLELAERVNVGLTIETLPHHLLDHGLAAILAVGTLIQLLTAWLGSAVSRLIASMADRPTAVPPRRPRGAGGLTTAFTPGPAARLLGGHGIRAPPGPASPSVLIP